MLVGEPYLCAVQCMYTYLHTDALLSAPRTGLIATGAHLRENGGAICKKKYGPRLPANSMLCNPHPSRTGNPGNSHRNSNQSQILRVPAKRSAEIHEVSDWLITTKCLVL